ncbi:MAG: DNA mismatch repair protein MutS [Parachlamydiales bacterium]
MTSAEVKLTPMMAQWQACKETAGDALLFFRMGDFYECFYGDAERAADVLELALTKRQEIPMAGVPWQQLEGYVERLIGQGISVAIAEQVEDPKEAKGLVKREVVRIVTPGTGGAGERESCYLACVARLGQVFGIAYCDLSTGEFQVCEVESEGELRGELHRIAPKELLLSEKMGRLAGWNVPRTVRGESLFDHQRAEERLRSHFTVHTLDSFGMGAMGAAVKAAGALLRYLGSELRHDLSHLIRIAPYRVGAFLSLDPITQRTLELTESTGGKTLLEVIDETKTPMGGRLMVQWLKAPLLSIGAIEARQERVSLLLGAPLPVFRQLQSALGKVRDLERLTMRVSSGYVTPRDFATLRSSLSQLPPIGATLSALGYPDPFDPLEDVAQLLQEAIVDEPPARLSDGGVFRESYHPHLPTLCSMGADSASYLADYQQRMREETGIKTLRVGYNRVFGYYLEISKGQAHLAPAGFVRRQTLANAERFISEELKAYEEKALTAKDELAKLEGELYLELRRRVARETRRLLDTAKTIAQIDCLLSFAQTARERRYVRPTLNESDALYIEGGRHPVVEAQIGPAFVPNDVRLDTKEHSLTLITGPNMAGKSTYLRQTALITLLAQVGSYVPATRAEIGICDKIFTRIGASDNLSAGQSTFMVEMQETANILNNATGRSLILLDEIGRGTSTYDGISIAWSVAEHLLRRARTLFATHYWELTRLEGVVNLHAAVSEKGGEVLFLHRVEPGPGDKSYGIHVAKLAGLPLTCIARAEEILKTLEQNQGRPTKRLGKREAEQLFLLPDPR